jgi:hypothetical protein
MTSTTTAAVAQREHFRGKTTTNPITFHHSFGGHQGCQMVCFQTKNPNFGKIWRALE